jgi:hypothetical protein
MEQSVLYVFVFINSSTYLLWYMEDNLSTKMPLLLRLSTTRRMEESPPRLLSRLTTQEAKERVFEGVERQMEAFRKGECSRFQASSCVTKELEGWEVASDKEKGKAFDSYLAEINSHLAIQDEARSATRETSSPLGATRLAGGQTNRKRIREEVEELLEQVSREGLDEEENDRQLVRKRAKEEEMPWYDSSSNSPKRASCTDTC